MGLGMTAAQAAQGLYCFGGVFGMRLNSQPKSTGKPMMAQKTGASSVTSMAVTMQARIALSIAREHLLMAAL